MKSNTTNTSIENIIQGIVYEHSHGTPKCLEEDIKNLLSQYEQEVVEQYKLSIKKEIEGMKKPFEEKASQSVYKQFEQDGYNRAISDVLEKLEE